MHPLLGDLAHGRYLHHNLQDEQLVLSLSKWPLPTTPLLPTQPSHYGRLTFA
jgi:hypothetical protein